MPPKATSRCGIWHHDLFRFAFVSGAPFLSVVVTPLLQGPWCSWISVWNTLARWKIRIFRVWRFLYVDFVSRRAFVFYLAMYQFCIVSRNDPTSGCASISTLKKFCVVSSAKFQRDLSEWRGKNAKEIFQKAWRYVSKENRLFEKLWECETFRVSGSLIDRIVEISGMRKVNIRN